METADLDISKENWTNEISDIVNSQLNKSKMGSWFQKWPDEFGKF